MIRTTVVTGAFSGIGKAVTKILLERGEQVIALDRGVSHDPNTRSMFTSSCNVEDSQAVEDAITRGAAHFGSPISSLIHCAGIYLQSPTEDLDMSVWSRSLATNVSGSFIVSAIVGKQLLASPHPGSIVLLSSTAAFIGDAVEPSAGYAASKGAVVSLGRQLAVEWGARGVRTNVVVPGVIDTPMTTIVNDPAGYEQVLDAIPLSRLGTAREVAEVCVFLASDVASFVNGAVVPVDGGQLIT